MAHIFGCSIEHDFFRHLEETEKRDILHEIMMGKSHIVMFKNGDEEKFSTVISVENGGIHIRELGGDYLFSLGYVENYCRLLALYTRKPRITVCSMNKTLQKMAMRRGFKPMPQFPQEFEKAVA